MKVKIQDIEMEWTAEEIDLLAHKLIPEYFNRVIKYNVSSNDLYMWEPLNERIKNTKPGRMIPVNKEEMESFSNN